MGRGGDRFGDRPSRRLSFILALTRIEQVRATTTKVIRAIAKSAGSFTARLKDGNSRREDSFNRQRQGGKGGGDDLLICMINHAGAKAIASLFANFNHLALFINQP
jgi:hypothetical protein